MCGLAGFARHTDAPGLDTIKAVVHDLTVLAQTRGRHATGFAVLGTERSFVRKWAMPMDELVKQGHYEREVAIEINEDTKYLISHTRHATLPNKHDQNHRRKERSCRGTEDARRMVGADMGQTRSPVPDPDP